MWSQELVLRSCYIWHSIQRGKSELQTSLKEIKRQTYLCKARPLSLPLILKRPNYSRGEVLILPALEVKLSDFFCSPVSWAPNGMYSSASLARDVSPSRELIASISSLAFIWHATVSCTFWRNINFSSTDKLTGGRRDIRWCKWRWISERWEPPGTCFALNWPYICWGERNLISMLLSWYICGSMVYNHIHGQLNEEIPLKHTRHFTLALQFEWQIYVLIIWW